MKKKNLWTLYGALSLASCAQSPEESTSPKGSNDNDDKQDQTSVSTDPQVEQITYPPLSEQGEELVKALMAVLPKLTANQLRGILHNDDWAFLHKMVRLEYRDDTTEAKLGLPGKLMGSSIIREADRYVQENKKGTWGQPGTCFGVYALLGDYEEEKFFAGKNSLKQLKMLKISAFIKVVGKGEQVNKQWEKEREVLAQRRSRRFMAEVAAIDNKTLNQNLGATPSTAANKLKKALEAAEKLLNGVNTVYDYAKDTKAFHEQYEQLLSKKKAIKKKDEIFSHDNLAIQSGAFDLVYTQYYKGRGIVPPPSKYEEHFRENMHSPVEMKYSLIKSNIEGVIAKREALVEVYKDQKSGGKELQQAIQALRGVLLDGKLQEEYRSYKKSLEDAEFKAFIGAGVNLDIRSQVEANVKVLDTLLLGYAAMQNK